MGEDWKRTAHRIGGQYELLRQVAQALADALGAEDLDEQPIEELAARLRSLLAASPRALDAEPFVLVEKAEYERLIALEDR